MIWYDFKYKWIDFSDDIQLANKASNGYGFIVENVKCWLKLSTDISELANYHGSYASNTQAGGRLFTFDVNIIYDLPGDKGIWYYEIVSKIQPENNLGKYGRWFYPLEFTDYNWNELFVNAKVHGMPEPGDIDCNWSDKVSFELYAETEKIYRKTEDVATGRIGIFWWITLQHTLPTPLWDTSVWGGAILCANGWNRYAPIKLQIQGSVTNPKIINLTTMEAYRLGMTGTNIIYDNRNITNDPRDTLKVTSSWVDASKYRTTGWQIFLAPWNNYILVTADSYDPATTVTVSFYDTFIR